MNATNWPQQVHAPILLAFFAIVLAQPLLASEDAPVLVGEVSREQVEMALPDWAAASAASEIDAGAAQELALIEGDNSVDIFFGTWCSDSKREVSRFFRALDETGSIVSFPWRLIAVDRDKQAGSPELTAGMDIQFVPTFVVYRDGEEVGRIIETSPRGIEEDLLALLTGEVTGVLSASQPQLATAKVAAKEGAQP